VALSLLKRALGPGLLASLVACRGLIKFVALLFEFLPRATWALVMALTIPTTLHVTGLDLFV